MRVTSLLRKVRTLRYVAGSLSVYILRFAATSPLLCLQLLDVLGPVVADAHRLCYQLDTFRCAEFQQQSVMSDTSIADCICL